MSNPFGSMIHGTPAMALASLFMRDAGLKSQKPTRVKRVLQIVCPGAASHIDLWDYKPELFKRSGEEMPGYLFKKDKRLWQFLEGTADHLGIGPDLYQSATDQNHPGEKSAKNRG
jgi:hypothetical protein